MREVSEEKTVIFLHWALMGSAEWNIKNGGKADSCEIKLERVNFVEELPDAAPHRILAGNSLFLSSAASHECGQTMSQMPLQEK